MPLTNRKDAKRLPAPELATMIHELGNLITVLDLGIQKLGSSLGEPDARRAGLPTLREVVKRLADITDKMKSVLTEDG